VRDRIGQRFGRLDILVHNHNVVERVRVEDCGESTYQRLLDANAKTAFLCTKVLGGWMAETGGGRIVYVSSIHGEKPTGASFVYAVAKGAVKMLCHEAALELGRHGVRANLIEMGPVAGDDERFASEITDIYRDYRYKVPFAELGTYDDLAHLVWFLALDESRFLNGSAIRLDGGFVLHYMDHKMKR
jgi:glucose 1-dehydrogenase